MPLNVVIELCKITKASKLFQRNFYLPLLEPLSPKDALRRRFVASQTQLQKMEHYIPVLEEYEERQARRKLMVKGQVKKRQKKKASMKYVTPLVDVSMPGHVKLKNIFARKSKGQGQCYTYRVADKNYTLVLTHQMERAIRDKEIIDVLVANDKAVFVLKNGQKISVSLINYVGDAPFYRGDGWTTKEIEKTHHCGKETMATTRIFEGKEHSLEEWELDMINMTTLRKKKSTCEDTPYWKAMMTTQLQNFDWEQFESQAKQTVQEQYTPVEDEPITMKVSSMESTMNVNEKLQHAGKHVMELLPTMPKIPDVIKLIKDEGQLTEVANVSGVKVNFMEKPCFVPGQMVKLDDSDLFVPGQTIFNENGDTEYVPGFTVTLEGKPTLIPGLVMGNDPNKPIFLPGTSTITEYGLLQFTETEDDLPPEMDQDSDEEDFEEGPLPPKRKMLEESSSLRQQLSEGSSRDLPDIIKDIERNDEPESDNGDESDDESESVASVVSVIEVCPPTVTIIKETEERDKAKEKDMMEHAPNTEKKQIPLADEPLTIPQQVDEERGKYEMEVPKVTQIIQERIEHIIDNFKDGDTNQKMNKVNESVSKVKEFEKEAEGKTIVEETTIFLETEKDINGGVGEKPAPLEPQPENEIGETPAPLASSSLTDITEALLDSPIKQPEERKSLTNESINEKCVASKEVSENIGLANKQASKLLERKEQFVNDKELKEKTNVKPVEDHPTDQQSQEEQDTSNQTTKYQTVKNEQVSPQYQPSAMEHEIEGHIEGEQTQKVQVHISRAQPAEGAEEQISNEPVVGDQVIKKQTTNEQEAEAIDVKVQTHEAVKKQAVETRIVEGKEVIAEEVESTCKIDIAKNQLSKDQTKNDLESEEMDAEVQALKEQVLPEAEKKQAVENRTVKKQEIESAFKIRVAKDQVESEAEEKQASKNATAKEQAPKGRSDKGRDVRAAVESAPKIQVVKNQPENQGEDEAQQSSKNRNLGERSVKGQVETEPITKGVLEELNTNDRKTMEEQVEHKQSAKDRRTKLLNENKEDEKKGDPREPSQDSRPWSSIVKEFIEVSVVVAGCYFINKLGKSFFNIHI